MAILLDVNSLPDGFEYPRQFIRVVELGLIDLEPWHILDGEHLFDRDRGLKTRYPTRVLVPFAERQDMDEVACWEPFTGDEVVIIHDYASPGWERRRTFATFYDWLRQAVEDLILFD